MKDFNNYPELWDYFQATKAYDTITSSRKIHSGLILFNKIYRGAWYHLLLLTAVYLIQRIRLSTNTVEFKFTINYVIDVDDNSAYPLTERDLKSFWVNGRHPRLMQLTIGNSIHGEFWYDDLKRRIALMVEKYESTGIYGLGIRLYGAESMKSTHEALPVEVMKDSVWDILKERDAVGLQEVVCFNSRNENSSVLKKVNNEGVEVPDHREGPDPRKGQEVPDHRHREGPVRRKGQEVTDHRHREGEGSVSGIGFWSLGLGVGGTLLKPRYSSTPFKRKRL